jgi:hypothetical protein
VRITHLSFEGHCEKTVRAGNNTVKSEVEIDLAQPEKKKWPVPEKQTHLHHMKPPVKRKPAVAQVANAPSAFRKY